MTVRLAADRVPALAASTARVSAAVEAGTLAPSAVADAVAVRAVAAATLVPAPRDPVEHLRVAHAASRRHLERLADHAPATEILAPMTTTLFVRLTRAPGAAGPPASGRPYTYTPRKVLRRVLDHGLDHLNQIDQWLTWRNDGLVPTPTDGWVPSVVTVHDDRLPLTATDLDAWPPLRRVLHHVARSELMYASALDTALPDDPRARFAEAHRRLTERLAETTGRGADDGVLFVNGYGTVCTLDDVVDEVLAVDGELLHEAGR